MREATDNKWTVDEARALYAEFREIGFESEPGGAGVEATECSVAFALLPTKPVAWQIIITLRNGAHLVMCVPGEEIRDNGYAVVCTEDAEAPYVLALRLSRRDRDTATEATH